ncbi:MAG: hypothetical protein H6721_16900 [Sandaracinus sp.]|nr:hypothetical protein [Sandaracinus sp.]
MSGSKWMACWALLLGCAANGGGTRCVVGADCASGMCRADGTCVPVDGDAGAGVDAGATDGATDAGMLDDAAMADAAGFDAGSLGCAPNHDGVIARSEVPIRAGLRATFRTATEAEVDLTGEVLGDGRRRWSLVGPFDGDRDVLVELRDPAGEWFAEDFPGATYFTPLTSESDLLGVFEVTGDALLLRGVASPESGFSDTRLRNEPAVGTLRFPLEEGDRWTDEIDVTGRALGVVTTYDETYESVVDAAGELETPFGTFEVLRIRTELTRDNGFGVVLSRVRTYAFVSECFGTVAVVRSQESESATERFVAAEVRRLAP